MKIINTKTISSNAVWEETDVTLTLDEGDNQKIEDALAILNKYKKAAFIAIKEEKGNSPSTSDWHMLEYKVEEDVLIIRVKDGMAG